MSNKNDKESFKVFNMKKLSKYIFHVINPKRENSAEQYLELTGSIATSQCVRIQSICSLSTDMTVKTKLGRLLLLRLPVSYVHMIMYLRNQIMQR